MYTCTNANSSFGRKKKKKKGSILTVSFFLTLRSIPVILLGGYNKLPKNKSPFYLPPYFAIPFQNWKYLAYFEHRKTVDTKHFQLTFARVKGGGKKKGYQLWYFRMLCQRQGTKELHKENLFAFLCACMHSRCKCDVMRQVCVIIYMYISVFVVSRVYIYIYMYIYTYIYIYIYINVCSFRV